MSNQLDKNESIEFAAWMLEKFLIKDIHKNTEDDVSRQLRGVRDAIESTGHYVLSQLAKDIKFKAIDYSVEKDRFKLRDQFVVLYIKLVKYLKENGFEYGVEVESDRNNNKNKEGK